MCVNPAQHAAVLSHVLVDTNAASIDLLRVDPILRVQVLNLAVSIYTVEAWLKLELGAQLGGQSLQTQQDTASTWFDIACTSDL